MNNFGHSDGLEMLARRRFGLSKNLKIKHKWTEEILLDFIIFLIDLESSNVTLVTEVINILGANHTENS